MNAHEHDSASRARTFVLRSTSIYPIEEPHARHSEASRRPDGLHGNRRDRGSASPHEDPKLRENEKGIRNDAYDARRASFAAIENAMEPITWTDEFSVGVEQLDEQHKRLVEMINRLIANPGATTKSETVSEVLNDMITYAQEHFGTEEALMRQCQAPNLDAHAAEHLAFWEKSVELCSATMLDVGVVPEAILQYLRDWLQTHIFLSDMACRPYFRSLPVESVARLRTA